MRPVWDFETGRYMGNLLNLSLFAVQMAHNVWSKLNNGHLCTGKIPQPERTWSTISHANEYGVVIAETTHGGLNVLNQESCHDTPKICDKWTGFLNISAAGRQRLSQRDDPRLRQPDRDYSAALDHRTRGSAHHGQFTAAAVSKITFWLSAFANLRVISLHPVYIFEWITK